MALNKESKNYYYNLGRVVAIVEIMTGEGLVSLVFNNAKEKLPYHLTKAMHDDKHNLHKELLAPAHVVLMEGELPKNIMTVHDSNGLYHIGYYHQKAYLEDKYKGNYGKIETVIEHHTPVKIEDRIDSESIKATIESNNEIEELRRQ